MNIDEFKQVALFAKENKIKAVKLEGISFEFSELAFLPETDPSMEAPKADLEDEDLLFHSAEG